MRKCLQWIANTMHIPKKYEKVKMFVDYWDLSRANLKDNLPLSHIDMLVNNTSKHAFFSLWMGSFGKNKVKMAPKDVEKITFCYKVMPFGLKNIRQHITW